MLSCMQKSLNKNGEHGIGTDPKEKLWIGQKADFTQIGVFFCKQITPSFCYMVMIKTQTDTDWSV